ncbi:MAG: cysteine synthase family protein [Armatimonadetes bacterium]|nr:cysteine synthase family protein [Armatimonadota bacterium]MBX3108813.1 cysteine synthase family protein [Fimbriimonadaceae bacterium]
MDNLPGWEPTPLVKVDGIYAKVEMVNPCGSIKDRIAHYIISRSMETGCLKPGMGLIEATSGNTGIALAYYGQKYGFPVTIVMPEHMTEERKQIIRSFGAELILCSQEGSFAEAAEIRDRMADENPGLYCTDQFSNPLNVECHERTTGQELATQVPGQIDAFVAGVGTGGTLIGVGNRLRRDNPQIHLAAVEPKQAAVMSGGPENSSHRIFGIGDGFIPAIAGDGEGGLHPMIDEVIVISDCEALDAAKYLAREHGLHVGISSGANFLAAKKLQDRFNTVATVFSDGARKYLSHGLTLCDPDTCQFAELCARCVIDRADG